jgi:hypothetical protein
VQTLWDFASFSIGYQTDYFQRYFEKMANWQKLGELLACDPTVRTKGGDYDISRSFQNYFKDGNGRPSRGGDGVAYITNILADSVGFRLRWTLPVRCLKIEPGKWLKAAPLPETNPEDFLFWYCPVRWPLLPHDKGGDLEVTPAGQEAQIFAYRGGTRAVLVHNMPHVLLPIDPEAKKPYYCLYGQLQAFEEDL